MADDYLRSVFARFRSYRASRFAGQEHLFDRATDALTRPPVLQPEHADQNVVMPPELSLGQRLAVLEAFPRRKCHRYFASFRCSQPLAQSVFGTLRAVGKVNALAGLNAEDGQPAFFTTYQGQELELEREVTTLGELNDRRTSVDIWLGGRTRVAVEAKFTESSFGACSRPELPKSA